MGLREIARELNKKSIPATRAASDILGLLNIY